MKKVVLIIVFNLVAISIYAQLNENPQRLKYKVLNPNGDVALTIIDDSRGNTMKLESVDSFYKYQLLDTNTSEPVFSSLNRGRQCIIDKSKVAGGTYYLRLYTRNFIITSEITILTSPVIAMESHSVAMQD